MGKRLLVYTLLLLGVVIAVVPFLITILASLKTTVELVQGVFSLPAEPQWANYRRAWVDGNFARFFVNSL
ncbi:MAG: carbohydrate ABC transporter permease, partial [Chloroflexota bacterium]|nr:carbohydrate ABC transporter permease [Chloroflexota bacterium]